VVVVIVIVIAVLIAGSSGDSGALKNYNASVYQLITSSTSNVQSALGNNGLESGNLTSTATSEDLAGAEQTARRLLQRAESLHAPSQMAGAQSSLVNVFRLRQQALLLIAKNAAKAADKNASKDALYEIRLGTSQLYASDVIYKTIVAVDIAHALNTAGVPPQQINGDQVIPDLGWLNTTWIADKIHAQQSTLAANANNDQPGLHGHDIGQVSVGGITLQAGITNKVKAADARHWVIPVGNGGDFNEYSVGCSIQIVAQSDAGTGVIPETFAHQTTNCNVELPSIPQTGPYQVIARIAKVPGETTLTNNTATYDVTFTP
jgi:hypothetical protein